MHRPHILHALERVDQGVLRDALDLDLDLDQRRLAVDRPNGGQRPDATADRGRGRGDRRDRIRADRRGMRRAPG
jgi:hypothetical protein